MRDLLQVAHSVCPMAGLAGASVITPRWHLPVNTRDICTTAGPVARTRPQQPATAWTSHQLRSSSCRHCAPAGRREAGRPPETTAAADSCASCPPSPVAELGSAHAEPAGHRRMQKQGSKLCGSPGTITHGVARHAPSATSSTLASSAAYACCRGGWPAASMPADALEHRTESGRRQARNRHTPPAAAAPFGGRHAQTNVVQFHPPFCSE